MNNFLDNQEKIKIEIENFPLEIDKGTKKMIANYHIKQVQERNKLVNKYLKKYDKIYDDLMVELKNRYNKKLPVKEINTDDINKANLLYLDDLLFTQKSELAEKLKFSFYINQMVLADSDLIKVNKNIIDLLNIFYNANIKLTSLDFNYTVFSFEYMDTFLNNYKNDKFDNIIKDKFDKIYWACPNLILHIKFSFIYLFNKYYKKLNKYVIDYENKIYNERKLIDKNIEDEYGYLISSTDNLYNSDEYLLTLDFVNNVLSPDDYLINSNNRKGKLSRFLNSTTVEELDDPSKYYLNVLNLNNVLKELNDYLIFKPFIDDVLKRSTLSQKNEYKNCLKEYTKLNKDLFKIKTNIFKLKNKGKKVLQSDIVKENDLINEINNKYANLIDIKITDDISNRINSFSNIKNALKEYIYNYNYFVISFNKINNEDLNWNIDDLYNRLINFVYSPYNQFIINITISSKENIYEIIANKFKLLKFNISSTMIEETLPELINDTNYILKVYYVEKLGLDFKTYSILNKIKKITG